MPHQNNLNDYLVTSPVDYPEPSKTVPDKGIELDYDALVKAVQWFKNGDIIPIAYFLRPVIEVHRQDPVVHAALQRMKILRALFVPWWDVIRTCSKLDIDAVGRYQERAQFRMPFTMTSLAFPPPISCY